MRKEREEGEIEREDKVLQMRESDDATGIARVCAISRENKERVDEV